MNKRKTYCKSNKKEHKIECLFVHNDEKNYAVRLLKNEEIFAKIVTELYYNINVWTWKSGHESKE